MIAVISNSPGLALAVLVFAVVAVIGVAVIEANQ